MTALKVKSTPFTDDPILVSMHVLMFLNKRLEIFSRKNTS